MVDIWGDLQRDGAYMMEGTRGPPDTDQAKNLLALVLGLLHGDVSILHRLCGGRQRRTYFESVEFGQVFIKMEDRHGVTARGRDRRHLNRIGVAGEPRAVGTEDGHPHPPSERTAIGNGDGRRSECVLVALVRGAQVRGIAGAYAEGSHAVSHRAKT